MHTLKVASPCVDSPHVTSNRNVVDARTNCGNSQVAGEVSTEIWDSGPLGFGAGSDEATKYAHLIASAAEVWTSNPKNAATAVDNTLYCGRVMGTQFKISMPSTGFIGQSFSAKATDNAGYPTRTTSLRPSVAWRLNHG